MATSAGDTLHLSCPTGLAGSGTRERFRALDGVVTVIWLVLLVGSLLWILRSALPVIAGYNRDGTPMGLIVGVVAVAWITVMLVLSQVYAWVLTLLALVLRGVWGTDL
jgi:hypothetical protein